MKAINEKGAVVHIETQKPNQYELGDMDGILAKMDEDLCDEGIDEAQKMADKNKLMRDGIREFLWVTYKELRGEYDFYIIVWSRLLGSLKSGYLEGYYDKDGRPKASWKSNIDQHAILSAFCNRYKLTDKKLKAYASRAEERFAKRALYSGTVEERARYETNTDGSKPYAKHDNELAMDEVQAEKELVRIKRARANMHAVG